MVKRDQAFQETLLAGMKSGPLRPPRCTVDRQRFASGGSTVRRSVWHCGRHRKRRCWYSPMPISRTQSLDGHSSVKSGPNGRAH